jgi:hypothetical protein
MSKVRLTAVTAILAALFLCSCTTTRIPELAAPLAGTAKGLTPSQFREHVLMFNFRGQLLDPLSSGGSRAEVATTGYQELAEAPPPGAEAPPPPNTRTEQEYLQQVIDGIVRRKQKEGQVKVLFFFHGGLNSRAAALARAARQIVAMRADRPDLYPVFVNWETSLPASYKDHLLWIRNGQDTYSAGLVLTPFVLASDVGRTVLDIPVASFMQWKEQRRHWRKDPEAAFVRVGTDCENPDLDFRAGPPHPPTTFQRVRGNALSTVTTILTKWWVAGLLSATGTKAWASMLYTSDRLFYSDHELHHPYKYTGTVTGSGGLSQFLRSLSKVLTDEDDITLVGHSAGTIPANKIIAMFGDSLPIRTLVYMAPAATVDELKDGGRVAEFLHNSPLIDGKPTRKLYILTLHERAEVSERFFLDLTPRGTLLAWLDEFIQPKHSEFPGMMLGRARNLRLHAHHIPCKIRPQISITAFGEDLSKKPAEPQRHGAFGDLPYWKETTWRPTNPLLVKMPTKP